MRLIDADALKAYIDIQEGRPFIGCTVGEALKIMVDEQPTVEAEPRWIPCSERLPEDEYVLISKKPSKISGDKWCVTIAIRTADLRSRKIQWRDIGFGVIQDDKVIAWIPLPEPYKEGGEQE